MAYSYKTLNISDLIDILQHAQDTYGDLPVVLSGDTEGNDFGTFDPESDMDVSVSCKNGILCLYPEVDKLDLNEIEGYKDNYGDDDEDDEEQNYLDEIEFDCD